MGRTYLVKVSGEDLTRVMAAAGEFIRSYSDCEDTVVQAYMSEITESLDTVRGAYWDAIDAEYEG